MLAPYPNFCWGSYPAQSPIADIEETINLYPEIMESPGAKSKIILLPTPGCTQFAAVTQTGGLAMFSTAATDGRMFAVVGLRFYEILIDGTTVERGTVANNGLPATIVWNGDGGDQLCICAGGDVYSYDLSTNTLTSELTGGYSTVGFAYGYFLAFQKTTGTVRLSDLFDGTTWDPTQFFQRTIGADAWNAMLVTSWGQIFLPGTKTAEYWYNAGTFPIPFAPHPSGLVSWGIAATFSVKEAGESIVWLGTNANGAYQVQAARGFRPERISNHAVEHEIDQYTRVDDCIAETYEEQGHAFALLKFPTAGVTWCYDFATGLWHKRMTWRPTTAVYEAWRLTYHCFGFGRHLWADSSSGVIYRSDHELTTDVDGLLIRRVRQAPSLNKSHRIRYYNRFEVLLESGLGNANPPGEDPQVVMQISNDGGQTWGPQRTCSAGTRGSYLQRVYWERNGSARDRAFRIIVSDPINNWRIVDAYLDIEESQEAA